MDSVDHLIKELNEIIALEGTESIETLSGYIVGEILCDSEEIYESLYEDDPVVEQIADIAADLPVMWETIKQFVALLEQENPSAVS